MASAALLEKAEWKVTGPDGKRIKAATDDDLATVWRAQGPQVTGQGILIDLKADHLVQRIVLDPGASTAGYPRSLDVYAGLAPDQLTFCASMPAVPDEKTKVITFNPTAARFLRLVIGNEQAGYPWEVAEIDVYGHRNVVALAEGNAVVVDPAAPEIVLIAAEDLGFYLGQVTEGAFPVVPPDEAGYRLGLRFRLETPRPVAQDLPFQQALSLEKFWISRNGNDIVLQGQTNRAVWYAARELLERHGVRWTFPSAHSDLLPPKRALELSFLPFTSQPLVYVRQWHSGSRETMRSELHRWRVRNGFNSFAMNLGGTAGMGAPSALQRVCFGPTHTMGYVFGNDVQQKHPEWYEGTTNKSGWCVVPDVTAPGLVDFVINRFKEEDKKPVAAGSETFPNVGFGLHPHDVPAWAVSERAEKLLGPFPKTEPEGDDAAAMNFDYSNLYGYLMDQTARRMEKDLPGKLLAGTAYENHRLAPTKVDKFPPNVFMLLCLHERPYNLTLSSPKLEAERKNLEAWGKKCSMLGVWDYILLDERKGGNWRPPTPLVSALVDRYAWLAKHGFCYLGSQTAQSDPENPWNGYAFARVLYNPAVETADVIDEFFAGYYKEAAEPMKRYYTTFENHLLQHEIGLQGYIVTFSYEPAPEAYPPELVAALKQSLADAGKAAKHWFVKERVARARACLNWALSRIP
jgi:hypothetical protein